MNYIDKIIAIRLKKKMGFIPVLQMALAHVLCFPMFGYRKFQSSVH